MEAFFDDFRLAYKDGSGYRISMTLSPAETASNIVRLESFFRSTNHASVKNDLKREITYHTISSFAEEEADAWVEIYAAYWKAIGEILNAENGSGSNVKIASIRIYETWKDLTNALIRGYTHGGIEAWTVPCLYMVARYLRIFATQADQATGPILSATQSFGEDIAAEEESNKYLEDAARLLNRIFQVCLSDRAPLEESRKWAIYNIINLLFKTYFRLNSIGLTKNILKAVQAYHGDMPNLNAFPMAHQVTFKYYVGVVHFLEEDYAQAERNLTEAWMMCQKTASHNKELILTYLIPCRLITTHTLPTAYLLASYPHLRKLFLPLSTCIKNGDLVGFDAALIAGEAQFVKRRIYLTLERARDVALRNLLRRVYLTGGFEESPDSNGDTVRTRRARVPVTEFVAALSIGCNEVMGNDEVECLLAHMIYKDFMKGYIARERGLVVLSKSGAFPGTGV